MPAPRHCKVAALLCAVLSILVAFAGSAAAQQLRVFIRAGKKTHGPGQHDHPRFLTEWTALLNERGAQAKGALRFPTAEELAATDVLVMYAAGGADITGPQRADFLAFLARGGGVVVIHDAVCGKDPHWFKTVVGGAWEHGHSKWFEGDIGVYYTDHDHPITRGASNFFVDDEIYYDLHMMPEAKVLARAFHSIHDLAPQMWVYEKDKYRAFVALPGHQHANFALPHFRAILLRGIAWAGRRPVDALVRAEELRSLRYPARGPLPPEQAHAKIGLRPEFDIRLVAAEPMIANPIAIDWDPQGRLWVAETPEYPFREDTSRPPRDRISILSDRDGDGRMDDKQVFADGLNLVTGMVLHQDGVIAAQAPVILFLRDTDGDGRADRRTTLYANLGTQDTHAVINNLRWGLDGWVYATHGYSGGQVTAGDGQRRFGQIGSGVVRFRPDGSAFEQVCSKNGNTWGMAVDWDNELFFTQATSGDHLNHVVMAEAALARGRVRGTRSFGVMNDHRKSFTAMHYEKAAYVQIDQVGGFTAAAGGAVYRGGAWPASYEGMYFMGEPTINIVHRDVVRPQGVTYTASRDAVNAESEFVMGTDLWFRPIDVRIGPDGAMYVVDFSNQAVIHNDTRRPPHDPRSNAAVRPDRNHDLGRIWRIHHRQARAVAVPFVAGAKPTTGALLAALTHPSLAVRMTAHRLLRESGAVDCAPELGALLTEGPAPARIHALWILAETGRLIPVHLARGWAAAGDHPAVRKNLLRAAAVSLQRRAAASPRRPSSGNADEIAAVVRRGLVDRDPRVRLEALLALQEVTDIRGFAADLLQSFGNAKDDWTRSAVAGVTRRAPLALAQQFLTSGSAEDALLALLTEQVAETGDPTQAAALVQSTASTADRHPQGAQVVLTTLHAALPRSVVPAWSDALGGAIRGLLRSENSAIASAALPFVERWDQGRTLRTEVTPLIRGMVAKIRAGDLPAPAQAALAVDLLAMRDLDSGILPALEGLLTAADAVPALQDKLIGAMGRGTTDDLGLALARACPRLPAALRERALGEILKRETWSLGLLDLVEKGAVGHDSLSPTTVHRLRNHGRPRVAARANQLIDKLRGPVTAAREALIAKLAKTVQQPPDLDRGKLLFGSACAICHRFAGAGKAIGPDLTGMGAHGPVALLTHVVDPNRAVEPNYVAHSIETADGATHVGIIVSENRRSVVLRHTGGDVEVRKRDIRQRRSTGQSLMPEGLESMGAEALRDLLGYMTAKDGKRFRVLDLGAAFSADSRRDVFAGNTGQASWRLRRFGTIEVAGVPFQVVNPAASRTGHNVLVLRGGPDPAAASRSLPAQASVPVGFRANTLHFLGGVAGWGHPWGDARQARSPALRATVRFADGSSEVHVFHNGQQFADYIRRVDVPGSQYVPELTRDRQVRRYSVELAKTGVIDRLELTGFDNHLAPATFAITAELADDATRARRRAAAAQARAPRKFAWGDGTRVLIVGGGSSHDFDRWFKQEDGATLGKAPLPTSVQYTDHPLDLRAALPDIDVLYLSNNQAIPGRAMRRSIMAFADRGKGVVLVHAALWYNWRDWPEYNRVMVGGGSRGHDRYGEFEVEVTAGDHPVMAGVPTRFRIRDELYRHKVDPKGTPIQVLAQATSPTSGTTFPTVWVVKHPKARIVCITLGHDGHSHQLPAYRRLLQNAVRWTAGK